MSISSIITSVGPIISLLAKVLLNWILDRFEKDEQKKKLHKEARKEAREAAKTGSLSRIAAADNKLRISK